VNASEPASTVVILGAGAWGTVLANLVTQAGHRSRLWSRRGDLGLAAALADVDIVVSAISMKGVGALAEQVAAIGLPPSAIIVSATKGLDPATGRTPAQLWQEAFPERAIVVLSGPNLSKEIERRWFRVGTGLLLRKCRRLLRQRDFGCTPIKTRSGRNWAGR
jgi:glycerol-3-phosphate dehydrogenase (NAD(P)+)